MSAENERPIIIKRIKKGGGDGHHGGAWKVAYADFVTAMMAFFLLMWLLNATTEVQRKGIADYFNPTIPINRVSGGGDGAFQGDSIFSEETLARSGTGGANRTQADSDRSRGETGTDAEDDQGDGEQMRLEGLEELLTGRAGESMASNDIARHIVTQVTDEGLIVEMFDLPDSPLFFEGTIQPTPVMLELIDLVSSIFVLATNDVAVNSFIRSYPVVVADAPIWDLTSGRAQMVRTQLEEAAFPANRIQRVTGYADRKPVVRNPLSTRNNRTEIILLRDVK